MYCVAIRRGVLAEVGPLDEAYGVGMFEDDDFAIRVREAGYRVACAEDVYVHHVGQGSFRKLAPEEYERIWRRNQAYFEKKWGRRWEAHVLRDGVAPLESKVGAD
jgi:GT2 family glycosyltransferase